VLTVVLALALGALALGGPPPAAAQPAVWVQLCEHPNYEGRCQTFTADDPDLKGSHIGSDRATSVRLAPGSVAALYEHNTFQGRCTTVTKDLDHLRRVIVGSDAVSSVRVGVGCDNPRPDAGVQLCEHQDYRGRCLTFTYRVDDLRDYGFADRVSALRLAPNVAIAALFEHPGYVGRCKEYKQDSPDLNVQNINDVASSVRIGMGCATPSPEKGVQFCRAINYRGVCDIFHNDMADLQGTSVGDNTISSVRLAPGLIVAVYDQKYFKGRCETFVADDPDLAGNVTRLNTISSFRIGQTC
jgi:hypothetical protein